MIFFSCHSAPNRWSISIKNSLLRACGTGSARPGLAVFNKPLLPRSKPLSGSSFLAKQSALRQAARRLQVSPLLFPVRDHIPRARKGCTEGPATSPAPHHEAGRVLRRLQRRIQNKWEHSGRQQAGMAKPGLYKSSGKMLPRLSSALAPLHCCKNVFYFRIKLDELQSQHTLAGMQHQIERPGQFQQVPANR